MPETTFLHIRSRDESPTRVLELPGVAVRIGRGEQCEVRLGEPSLAEVQCMLRRRGESWHIQPVGPPGRITIEGRAVEQSRPLPLGTAVRVGDHWLTLRPADPPAVEGWGKVEPHEPRSFASPSATPGEDRTESGPGPGFVEGRDREPVGGFEAERERLQRWQERLEQREQWLKTRQEERRWEARFRAAGEGLRARSAPSAARPASAPPPPIRRPDPPHRRPGPPAAPRVEARPRPGPPRVLPDPVPPPPAPEPSPPVVEPVVERARLDSAVAVAPAPAAKPVRSRAVSRSRCSKRVTLGSVRTEAPEIEAVGGPDAAWPHPAIPALDFSTLMQLLISGEPASAAAPPVLGCDLSAPPALPELLVEPDAYTVEFPHRDPAVEEPRTLISGDFEAVESLIDLSGPREPIGPVIETVANEEFSAQPAPDANDPSVEETSALAEACVAPEARVDAADREPEGLRLPIEAMGEGTIEGPDVDESMASPTPAAKPALMEEEPIAWPSARIIFEHQTYRRDRPARPSDEGETETRVRGKRRAVQGPTPTIGREPGQWTVPATGWLWAPATATLLLVGMAGVGLAWTWAKDDLAAGLAADRLLGREAPLSVEEAEGLLAAIGDDAAWWKTTAGHLLLKAAVADRAGGAGRERAVALLQQARGASPAQAGVRLALARTEPAGPAGTSLAGSLGLSRDAVSLAWTGRRLLEAGKVEPGLRAYRAALELASGADPSSLGPPAFLGDRQVGRFAMPGEGLMAPIVRELTDRDGWSFEQWSAALPEGGAAPLVAARVLREKGSPDAEKAIDALLARPAATAVGLAARAEALAMRDRWEEAEAEYRKAIAGMTDDRTRRSWSLNLADVCGRLNDDTKRRAAWEAAKGGAPGDEITRRVSEAQAQAGVGEPVASAERRPG